MSFLQDFVENQKDIPLQINQQLKKIQELDIIFEKTQIELEILQEKFLEKFQDPQIKFDVKQQQKEKQQIQILQKQCHDISNEKLQLSDQLYSQIDDSIQELDQKMKEQVLRTKQTQGVFQQPEYLFASQNEIQNQQQAGIQPSNQNQNLQQEKVLANIQNSNPYEYKSTLLKRTGNNSRISRDQKAQNQIESQNLENLALQQLSQQTNNNIFLQNSLQQQQMSNTLFNQYNQNPEILYHQVDPSEPVYCYCQQYANGEMISCDNPFCEVEWFHFSCAGLNSKPTGKWYCKNCQALNNPSKINIINK